MAVGVPSELPDSPEVPPEVPEISGVVPVVEFEVLGSFVVVVVVSFFGSSPDAVSLGCSPVEV